MDLDFVAFSETNNFCVGFDVRGKGSYTYMQLVGNRASQMVAGIGRQDFRCLSCNFG